MKNQTTDRESASEQNIPASITISALNAWDNSENEMLLTLENHFLAEIGEAPMTKEKHDRLCQAVRGGKITFFIAKQDLQTVGMCSVSKCFSTFSCSEIGMFDDFYIEPGFRGRGIARKLAQAAQNWCIRNQAASLTVCCAPCDEQMYQALGFDVRLGITYAHLGGTPG